MKNIDNFKLKIRIKNKNTQKVKNYFSEPPVSDHLKCQALVVTYGEVVGQNFASSAYGTWRNFLHVYKRVFFHVSILRKVRYPLRN